ncbi:MAG: AraC family transcriptional regulator [Bacteroidota bacterium]
MLIKLDYTNANRYINQLTNNYNFGWNKNWNLLKVNVPAYLGKGCLQIFSWQDFHFIRGNWQFDKPTQFLSNDNVGSNDLIDFRIAQNKSVQSSFLKKENIYEWDITRINGLRLFIPENKMKEKRHIRLYDEFEKYCNSFKGSVILDEIFSIQSTDSQNAMILESKFIEFTHYWLQFLNSNCQPHINVSDYHKRMINSAKDILDNNLSSTPNIKELARLVGLNTNDLKVLFKQMYQITIRQYIISKRMEKAKHLLLNTNMPVTEICHLVGYHNRGYFANTFYKYFNITPKQFRFNYIKNSF